MKIYRVMDNGQVVLTTDSRFKALEEWYKRMEKHQQVQDWGWIDEEEVK